MQGSTEIMSPQQMLGTYESPHGKIIFEGKITINAQYLFSTGLSDEQKDIYSEDNC